MTRKMRSAAIIALIIVALAFVGAGVRTLQIRSINSLVPGPEGIDAKVYGLQWTYPGVDDPNSIGNHGDRIHFLSETSPGTVIGRLSSAGYDYHNDLVLALPDGYNTQFRYDWVWNEQPVRFNSLNYLCEVSKAQVWEVNYRGDPLGVRQPTEIVWSSWETQPVETGNQITWEKYGAYIVPVDFIVQVSVRPNIKDSVGTIEDLHYWFVLDVVRWYNAYSVDLMDYDGTPEDVIRQSYTYKGAFPIFAWVSQWDPFVIEDENGKDYSAKDLPDDIENYVQISPSLKGRRLVLYTQPDWEFEEILSEDVWANPYLITGLEQRPNMPDPRFAETVYAHITLSNFGAKKEVGGWWWAPWAKYYYPTVFIRVRLLYLLWGEWIYLWTQEQADEQDYQWQNRSSVIHDEPSWWTQFWAPFLDWLENPFNSMLLMIGVVAVFITIIVVAVRGGSKIVVVKAPP